MGRYLGSAVSAIDSFTLPAGVAIAANDLLVNTESGLLYVADDALGVQNEFNNTVGLVAIAAPKDLETDTDYAYGFWTSRPVIAELGNGNIACIYSGNGTAATGGINLRIRNLANEDIAGRLTVTSATGFSAEIRKLNASLFMVINDENSALRFTIYNNDGSVSVAATTVAASTYSGNAWASAALSNGDLVIAYSKMTSGDLVFDRYNTSGAIQGTETTVEAGVGAYNLGVTALANGGFVISFIRPVATAKQAFARYNAGGTLQGSVTTLVAGSNGLIDGNRDYRCTELTNGNLVFLTGGAADSYPDVHVYDSSGVLVLAIDLGTTEYQSILLPAVVATSYGFAVLIGAIAATTSGTYLLRYTSAGILKSRTKIEDSLPNSTASTGYQCNQMFFLGAAGFLVFRQSYNPTGPAYSLHMFRVDDNGNLLGSVVKLADAIAQSISAAWAGIHSNGSLYFHYSKNLVGEKVMVGTYHCMRKALIGVASASAAKDANCTVQTKGSFTINQSMSTTTFNHADGQVLGTKGVVNGTTLTISGV